LSSPAWRIAVRLPGGRPVPALCTLSRLPALAPARDAHNVLDARSALR